MSNIEEELLPLNVPTCECFNTDPNYTMSRCADVANASNTMVSAFHQLARAEELCKTALPYLVDLTIISLLTYLAKANGPALEYGSKEMEWESELLLKGLEARVLDRMHDVYERGRKLGINEEIVNAMRERDKHGREDS